MQANKTGFGSEHGKGLVATLIVLLLAGVLALAAMFFYQSKDTADVITKDGVISKIQTLSRLQTSAFNIETVVTSNKQGTWQALWQDKQKGLFVIKGRVLAGIDLGDIGTQMVQITQQQDEQGNQRQTVQISLPPAEIFEVFLDEIEIYDWQTGLFGALDKDPALFAQVQSDAKAKILQQACQGGILTLAMDNGVKQIENLFTLAAVDVSVVAQGTAACQLPAK
ncbi:DUF4230 domain-containing protein [Moraxella marmotae]|uniref:DUF4230 domain-containing protein n=1 Tax=Moraxella marmotae TaxID=3344520 RepID=UPI0035F3FA30